MLKPTPKRWVSIGETVKAVAEPPHSKVGTYALAEKIFQLGAGAGFGVAVFDDYSARERESPFLTGGMENAAGARDNDGVFGDD